MAYRTTGKIEIAAAPPAVFPWLTDPRRLPQWTGVDAAGLLPGDSSELRPGYRSKTTFAAPDGQRDLAFEVTAYEPPLEFSYRETYRGGESVVSYRLSESGSGTLVEFDATTDAAAPAGIPDEVEQRIDQMPAAVQRLARAQIHRVEKQLESGEMGAMPGVQEKMNEMVNDELAKLKQCVEGA
jgi:uncharacterized protein YndB with AHSA1/START domain